MCILVWVDHTGANHDLTSFIYDIYATNGHLPPNCTLI